jgi:hypothetical protein
MELVIYNILDAIHPVVVGGEIVFLVLSTMLVEKPVQDSVGLGADGRIRTPLWQNTGIESVMAV